MREIVLDHCGYGATKGATEAGVLALFGRADVNPRQIKVAADRRARPTLPPVIELTQVKAAASAD